MNKSGEMLAMLFGYELREIVDRCYFLLIGEVPAFRVSGEKEKGERRKREKNGFSIFQKNEMCAFE